MARSGSGGALRIALVRTFSLRAAFAYTSACDRRVGCASNQRGGTLQQVAGLRFSSVRMTASATRKVERAREHSSYPLSQAVR